MDALALLLKHKIPDTFISSSNHISILVWFHFNEDRTEKKLGGITFTYSSSITISDEEKLLLAKIKTLFNSKSVPTLEIIFNQSCTEFSIDKKIFNAENAINYINETLGLPPKSNNGNSAKPINDKLQVKDAFHLWRALLHKDLKDNTTLIELNSSDDLGMRTT